MGDIKQAGTKKKATPTYLLLVVAISLFTSEVLLMFLLNYLPQMGMVKTVILDASLLVVLLFPVLYYFLFKPMNSYIDEREKAEVELKRSDEKVRAIIATIGEGVISMGSDFRVSYVNQELCGIFGYRAEELEGMQMTNLMPEKYRDRHNQGMARYLKIGKKVILGKRLELEGLKKDGTVFPIELRIEETGVDDAGEKFFTGAIRDISDRRAADYALKKLNQAIEQTAEIVMITDADGKIEYVNRSFEKVTGFTKEEAVGENPRILKSDKQEAELYKELWGTIKSGSMWKGALVNKKKNGELYDQDVTITPTIDDSGMITNYVAIMRDVSVEKMLQQQLLQSEKLSSIGTFVSGVAHELNNPLSSVLGYTESLIQDRGSLPKDVLDDLLVINENSERAAAIVKNLLKFTRSYKPGKKMAHLNEMLDNTVNLQRYHFKTEGIIIVSNFATTIEPFLMDSNKLQQVFTNLLLNARSSMAKAGVRGEVRISTERKGNEVLIVVENDGPTIPDNVMDKIFDPFFTTKSVGEGTGLGLSISVGIVKEHDGRMWAENVERTGVRFFVSLPMKKSGDEAVEKSDNTESDIAGSRVLVVEDEESIRRLVTRELVRKNLFALSVANGVEAVDMLEKMDFDVIVSDVKMPEMGGLELGKWISENKPGGMERFILMTGAIDAEIEKFSENYGCQKITKPFKIEELIKKVAKITDNSGRM